MKHGLLKILITLGFLLGVLTLPLKAADGGFAIGVYGSKSTFDTTGSELQSGLIKDVGSHSNEVDFGSIFAEATIRDDVGGWAVGVEYIPGEASLGTKARTDTDIDSANTGGVSGTYTAKAEISDHWTAYVEPIYYPFESIGIYGKVGLSRVTVNSLESLDVGINSSTYGNADVYGGLVGFGIRATSSSGILMKVEYTNTQYESVKLSSASGNGGTVTADPEQESFRIALGYQF